MNVIKYNIIYIYIKDISYLNKNENENKNEYQIPDYKEVKFQLLSYEGCQLKGNFMINKVKINKKIKII